ncbi:hypothetical protein NIES2109_61920 (plasmid) [Nostoc sp. HK-01]|nr:hypothetical protein NIES2109_61920 [Nostoc sp. HK-01]
MLPRTKLSEITPIVFCRQFKALETGMKMEQVIMAENERGTFKEYCLILSRELEVPFETVKSNWGAGIEFPNMPPRIRSLLKYVLDSRTAELIGKRQVA